MFQIPDFQAFAIIIILLLIIWTLVSFWQRFLENLMFTTFGFDPLDTTITFFIAISLTMTLIFIVWILKWTIFPMVDVGIVGRQDTGGETGVFDELTGVDRFSPSVVTAAPRIPFI